MNACARAMTALAAALGAIALMGAASILLALASVGVFATSGNAWTTELAFAGVRSRVNVVGLVRLATLPGMPHLLDGRTVTTQHGTLRFVRDGAAARIVCSPCRVTHRDLASVPVQFRSLALRLQRHDDALDGALFFGAAEISFTGRLRADSIELAWQLAPTELASLYRALGDAVPEAAFARIDGTVSAEGTLSLPSRHSRVRWSAEALEVGGLGTEPLQYGWFRFACAQADGSTRPTITGDGEKGWVAADATGPYLAAAVLAAEDQRFHAHGGYDEQAIAEILADLQDGRPSRGASTITQQLARTLFTGGERTAARKLRELLYAIEMERTLGKARIQELYLNTVHWGPGVCGAKAAARSYFRKPPARLTAIEAAWLAGALRSPQAAWEQRLGSNTPDRTRATLVLMQMRDWPKRERERFAKQPLAFAPASKAKKTGAASPPMAGPPTASSLATAR